MGSSSVLVRAYEGGLKDGKRATVYETLDGMKVARIGGSPAWRNCNPGNIRPSRYNKEQIGSAWGFAVFSSREAGLRAVADLLGRPAYARLTLRAAIHRYAPPSDNNPSDAYAAYVSRASSVGLGEVLGDIGKERLAAVVAAMVAFEGEIVGVMKTGIQT